MKSFFHVQDIGDLRAALDEAQLVKQAPFANKSLGENKVIMLVFFNSSLRTRLSSQKAAINLGMSPIVLNIGQDSWKLETELGVVMDGDKSEHLREAIPVMASYCDLIGVRSFAGLTDREFDYAETILSQFVQYSGKPVISLESATVHPCQAFADLITIDEYVRLDTGTGLTAGSAKRPKVVLTWAPHPKALPQAVPNSFAEWMNAAAEQGMIDFVITHPEGYELDEQFTGKASVIYNQDEALKDADFVYAKNWSCPGVTHREDYGKILSKDMGWTVSEQKMALTNNARFMHCLPVRRNMIVSDAVIDSERSVVIPEAANRWVSAQVVMKRMLEEL